MCISDRLLCAFQTSLCGRCCSPRILAAFWILGLTRVISAFRQGVSERRPRARQGTVGSEFIGGNASEVGRLGTKSACGSAQMKCTSAENAQGGGSTGKGLGGCRMADGPPGKCGRERKGGWIAVLARLHR